ncbi:MAG: hypothetical protein GX037_05525, partial [Trueperella sp.]|nr:hypothetical protein [Trueperella sp.]
RAGANPWRNAALIDEVERRRRAILPLDDWGTANAQREAKVRALSDLISKLEER